jgi:hypothetical protein
MSKYVIERTMPGPGQPSPTELRAAARVSNEALATLSPRLKWQQSYVADDKIFCVYIAGNPEAIHEHARLRPFLSMLELRRHRHFHPGRCSGIRQDR